jgi:hypothetical protein
MRVRVTTTLGDLVVTLAGASAKFKTEAPAVVKRNAEAGNRTAQRIARQKSGPHGSAYYKRLSAEMTGELTAEYGPHDGGTPVGAGFRHGGPNMDLAELCRRDRPEVRDDDVGDMADGLFW